MEGRTDSGSAGGFTPVPAGTSAALVESLGLLILEAHPTTQAIYRYGTWGTAAQRPDSDLDLAVLLPHAEAVRCVLLVNAVPLALIGWLFVSLKRPRAPVLEAPAGSERHHYLAPCEVGLGGALGPIRSRSNAAVSSCARK